jgi:hypothetical protein
LWEEGSSRTIQDLKKMGTNSQFIFEDDIKDTLAESYTFFNLKAASIYKAQVVLVFRSSKERVLDYWPSL